MSVSKGELVLYGIDDFNEKVTYIIESLNLRKHDFEIKLIIIEAVNNAFIHGNNKDKSKPISISWQLKDNLFSIEVTDCGEGFKNLEIYKKIEEDDILCENGRGLYLISCYTDEVEFKDSSIIMKKYIC